MKILGLDVPIKYIEEDLGGNMGCYDMIKSVIKVCNGLPTHTKRETILHEVIECIVHTNQLGIEHKDLTTLSMALYQVLRENGGNIGKWK